MREFLLLTVKEWERKKIKHSNHKMSVLLVIQEII